MKLMHFSDAAVIDVRSCRHHLLHPACKPYGLWVSDESNGSYGWRSWAADEQHLIGRNAFDVQVAADAALLTLTSVDAVRSFDSEYRTRNGLIDWERVAERWQGIVITPYQWELRLSELNWYYSWDCASGCIWDTAAIASVTAAVEVVRS